MTAKRFTLNTDSTDRYYQITDEVTGDLFDVYKLSQCETLCDLLNSLNDENEQLKQRMQTILKLTKKIEDCTHDIKMISDKEMTKKRFEDCWYYNKDCPHSKCEIYGYDVCNDYQASQCRYWRSIND